MISMIQDIDDCEKTFLQEFQSAGCPVTGESAIWLTPDDQVIKHDTPIEECNRMMQSKLSSPLFVICLFHHHFQNKPRCMPTSRSISSLGIDRTSTGRCSFRKLQQFRDGGSIPLILGCQK